MKQGTWNGLGGETNDRIFRPRKSKGDIRRMKKYDIDIIKKSTYNFFIEAENEEEAKKKAYNLYETNSQEYFSDCDIEIEVGEF